MSQITAANKSAHLMFTKNSENVEKTECVVKGKIPLWLNGRLIRNGPGEYDVGEDSFKHLFDGHAFIHKYDIFEGKVSYSSKFVLSEDYKINHKNEKIIIGSFGTATIPDPCKNIFSRFFTKFFTSAPRPQNANVNIANLGKAYYTLSDAPWGQRIDADSLETGDFLDLTTLFGMTTSTAHPHFDVNGDFYNVGTHAGVNGYYGVYKIPVESMDKSEPIKEMQLHSKVVIDTPLKPCYYHSFGLSENYITIHDHPVRLNALKIMKATFTWEGVLSAFEHQTDRESVFHVIDRKKQAPLPIKYCSKGRFTFHHINSYELTISERNFLIVDLMCADGPTFFYFWMHIMKSEDFQKAHQDAPSMWPYRFVLPLDVGPESPKGKNLVDVPGFHASAEVRDNGSVFLIPELLFDQKYCEKFCLWGLEFPVINYKQYNTKPYKFMYCVGQEGHRVLNSLCKINVETKEMLVWKEEGYFPSEPIFVKNPEGTEEDNGIILSSVVNLNPDDPIFLLILDAKTFAEIGRAEVMAKLNYSFHGFFDTNLPQ